MEKDLNTNLIESVNLGHFGEDQACRFLRKKGFRILERNYRIRTGEVDIIAKSGKMIIFVEVKTRTSSDFALPWEAVGFRKRKNLKSAAKMYIRERALKGFEYRFDVISIIVKDGLKPEIEWIQSAF